MWASRSALAPSLRLRAAKAPRSTIGSASWLSTWFGITVTPVGAGGREGRSFVSRPFQAQREPGSAHRIQCFEFALVAEHAMPAARMQRAIPRASNHGYRGGAKCSPEAVNSILRDVDASTHAP